MFGLMLSCSIAFAAPDPNFHIYLAFGQSNMEGQGKIAATDANTDPRFQLMPAVSCGSPSRTMGTWVTATAPLVRCNTFLSPLDYFGKTMLEKLPSNIKIGVVPVAVAGTGIELFDKNNYQSYLNSMATEKPYVVNIAKEYGSNPYKRLVDMAKKAQESGVIKGILLHQGESNTGDNEWGNKVKAIYDNLLADLGLQASDIPILAGNVVDADFGGLCSGANSLINALPQKIANAHVISSKGLADTTDNLHFTAASYRELGKRYAEKMLTLLPAIPKDPVNPPVLDTLWIEPECSIAGTNWETTPAAEASNGYYLSSKSGLNSLDVAPTGTENNITISLNVDTSDNFQINARLNCPSADDDSYWLQVDNGSPIQVNQLTTSGWEWKNLTSLVLTKGQHTLTIGYREDGALLDKLQITNSSGLPTGLGLVQSCQIPLRLKSQQLVQSFEILQPSDDLYSFRFSLPQEQYVSLAIFNMKGEEVMELSGRRLSAGNHILHLNATKQYKGMYFFRFITNDGVTTGKFKLGTP